MQRSTESSNYAFQKIVVAVGLVLFAVKLLAWYLTRSVAIYSDALESIVNIISSLLSLYSLYLASQPKDANHPYGHGKVEFLSSAVEGILISLAGILIIIEAVQQLFLKTKIVQLDYGIILILFTALVNCLLGYGAIRRGRKTNSVALEATGRHLMTDTYSTIGIIVGLGLLYFTEIAWVDAATAIIFSGIILYTGFVIIRRSVSGIMDEADEKLIREVVDLLNEKRRPAWIDLHNLRIIKYGSKLHIDLHMTLPYYFTVLQAHDEIEEMDIIINAHFGDRVELFVHTDPCVDFSCLVCSLENCEVRRTMLEKKLSWNFENVLPNRKHRI
ncbi:MAG: cation transporter [Crocinitomicaceae bacterium]|jgi:cation diffusion facilitator family transporter|nr:cation transporter [Crocinitomicaceae bacterium]